MPHHVIPGVCDTKSLALYKISCGSSAQQDSISYMQKYMRTIMNFKSLIFMNHWCRAKSTAQSTQRAMSVIFCHLCSASGWRGEVLYQWACWGVFCFLNGEVSISFQQETLLSRRWRVTWTK